MRKTAANPKDFVRKCLAYSFLKMPQIVVQSRTLSLPAEMERTSEWFNLRIPESDYITEQTIAWKKDHKHPLNIYVFWSPGGEDMKERYLLEHWQCRLLQKSNAPLQKVDVRALYNKFVIMFRSLAMCTKILPGYKAYRAQIPTSPAKLVHTITPTVLTAAFPFGSAKPEKCEIGCVETPFGTIEMTVQYRKDVSFALDADRPEVIPAESIIPDYAPSLSNKIPIRTKPMSIQSASLQRHSSSNVRDGGASGAGGRQRSHTTAAHRTGGYSQPTLPSDRHALSFSPPVVGAQSMWGQNQQLPKGRSDSDAQFFPTFTHFTPNSVGAYSSSPRFPPSGAYSSSPRSGLDDYYVSPRRRSGSMVADGERVLTAVSPPSFSMYERAMHESPDPEFDGPVFSIEGSFNEDDVNSFVRFCQSKPVLLLVEDEQAAMKVVNSSPPVQIKSL